MIRCATADCVRAGVRRRDDNWYCLYHPDQTAPSIDLLTGKLRDPKDPRKVKPHAPTSTRRRKSLTAELQDLEATNPNVAAASRSFDEMVEKITRKPLETPTPVAAVKAARPQKPRALRAPRKPRAQADVDGPDAARRYQAGERLFDLAKDLHIGVARLRTILREQGVTIRSRGAVIDPATRAPAPLDTAEAERLYATGLDLTEVAFRLGVRTARVRDHLASRDLLRLPASIHRGPITDVRIKLDAAESFAARDRANALGLPLNGYLRQLLEADLTAVGTWPSASSDTIPSTQMEAV